MPATRVIDVRREEDSRDVVHRAVQALAEGNLVGFPTETVYGVAASARNADAVDRLLSLKGRPEGQPLTLAIKSADDALDFVPQMSPLARRLARRCWPGPVTLVLADNSELSLVRLLPAGVRQAVAPTGSIGLRVPAHPLILDVMRMLSGPLVLTSANRSGQPDASNAEEVVAALGDGLQLVLDDGPCRYGQPSSVVRVDGGELEILRAGVVNESTLRRLSSFMILFVCTGNTCRSPMASAVARHLLAGRFGCRPEELEERGYAVLSAGVAANHGSPATAESVDALSDMGIGLVGHESQPVTEQLAQHVDVMFTMTSGHREAIVRAWPHVADRVHLLRPDRQDISDPIGGPLDVYRRCAEQIRAAIETRLSELDLG